MDSVLDNYVLASCHNILFYEKGTSKNEDFKIMAKEDLIPLTKRPPEVAAFLRKKGGSTKSQVKKDAAKWREVKKRMKLEGLNNKDTAWMIEKLENRGSAAADIMMYVEKIKQDVHPNQRIALGNLMKEVGKFQHGEKTENLNVNVNMDAEEFERRLMSD